MRVHSVIPAGGLGSRLGAATHLVPKPLLEIGPRQEPLIKWSLSLAEQLSAKVHVTVDHKAEHLAEFLAGSQVNIVREHGLLGSGNFAVNGIVHDRDTEEDDAVVLIPADHVHWGIDLSGAVRFHESAGFDLTIPTIRPVPYGEYLVGGGTQRYLVEGTTREGSRSTVGIFIARVGALRVLFPEPITGHCNFYHDIVKPLIARNDTNVGEYALAETVYWEDAGTPERFARAHQTLTEMDAQENQ